MIFVFRKKQWLRFSFYIGKIFVGISIINDIGTIAMLHGPVNHVLSCFPIINSLWSPHTFQILLIGIFFWIFTILEVQCTRSFDFNNIMARLELHPLPDTISVTTI